MSNQLWWGHAGEAELTHMLVAANECSFKVNQRYLDSMWYLKHEKQSIPRGFSDKKDLANESKKL